MVALLLGLLAGACEEGVFGPPEGAAVFEIDVSGETFRAAVTDTAEIRLLTERMESGSRGVINGDLRPGWGGINGGWGWHLDPETVHVADMAIELCDGRPSMVQADLSYWIGTVGQYCPWGAKVLARTE
jgi:hypothetical protein